MAVLDQITPRGESLLSRIGHGIYNAMERLIEANSRIETVRYYQAMSDAELAKRGLTRDQIVGHVFRDKFC